MAKKFYAVKIGRKPGVYKTWAECKAQVDGFSGATYKSFLSLEEAEQFIGANSEKKSTSVQKRAENSGNKKNGNVKDVLYPDMKDVLSNPTTDIAVAYVDGSYHNGTKEFSYGAVVAFDGKEYCFSEKVEDESLVSMRNVAGEIKGAECAMRFALEHGCKEVYIYHDYEGIAKWCLGEWKTNKEGTKAYKAFFDSIQEKIQIYFVKVKGHSDNYYNDLADSLAKKALGIG